VPSRARFDPAAHLIPVKAGHLDVDENNIRRLYLYVFEGRSTVADKAHGAVNTRQVRLDQLAIGKTVINDQYNRHSLSASPLALLSARSEET
jgi:hypothetical protein